MEGMFRVFIFTAIGNEIKNCFNFPFTSSLIFSLFEQKLELILWFRVLSRKYLIAFHLLSITIYPNGNFPKSDIYNYLHVLFGFYDLKINLSIMYRILYIFLQKTIITLDRLLEIFLTEKEQLNSIMITKPFTIHSMINYKQLWKHFFYYIQLNFFIYAK